MGFLTDWLEHYGYVVLFLALMLEMLALPLPGEVLMSYAGLLVYQGKLSWPLSILSAFAGVSAGVTLSYLIGFRLGKPFFERYGSRIHLGPDKLDKISDWFTRYGNKVLLFAYFIPGVRHITGYFSGTTRIAYRKYAFFAYAGGFLWVGLFISIGKVLGPKWEQYHHTISRYLLIGGVIAAVIFALVYLYRKKKTELRQLLMTSLTRGMEHFHSLGRIKLVVLAAFAAFVIFLSLIAGLIQDFLGKEFGQFDEVAYYIVHQILDEDWTLWMKRLAMLGTYYVFAPIIFVTVIWIVLRGKDKMLELAFLAGVIVGGEALDEILRRLFHRMGPAVTDYTLPYTFPSEQTLLSMTVCGFAAYLLVRHYGNLKIRTAATLLVLLLCFFVGLSRVYLNVQFASDVAAGYVFGGAWISLNIILLEIFRVLQPDEWREKSNDF